MDKKAMVGMSSGRKILCVSVVLLLAVSFLLTSELFAPPAVSLNPVDIYVGVDAAFGSVEETKQLIDQVKGYTNLFVVGSTATTWNLTRLNDVCQYLNDSDLNFMIFAHPAAEDYLLPADWLSNAQEKWSSSFLGLYTYDEPGGHQVDHDYIFMCAQKASSIADAATTYVANLTYYLSLVKDGWNTGNFPLFTSDYALQEYDYRAGYDAVFTEFWKNNSRPLAIALGRGAATVHGKEWGVMITGHLNDTSSGAQVYKDLVYAYEQGAKYVLVFDYPSLRGGLLAQEHFDALQQFWLYAQTHPRPETSASERVAFVAPKDFGSGFRGSNERLWGLFDADEWSVEVWNQTKNAVDMFAPKLDIIYEDSPQITSVGYGKLVFWNGTEIASPYP